ncbi:serine hydrolase, partial [Acidobacteriota bacterium]
MTPKRKLLVSLILAFCILSASLIFGRSFQNLEDKISRIENSLVPMPGIVIKGESIPKSTLKERMELYKVPGVSIAVINGYRIEWVRSYGVTEAGSKNSVTSDTMFQAASISKPVAAMAVLYYIEQGLLELDEDINDKLISWKVPDEELTREEKVTLRRLLSHSAGMTVHGFPGYRHDKEVPTVHQILDGRAPANTKEIRVDTKPGTIWRYSGGGYTILQQLLIDILNKPFPDIIEDVVLYPLEMTNSTYEQPLPDRFKTQAATAHHLTGRPVKGRWHTYPELAAAGLWTTPTDLARLAIEVMLAYKGLSNKVLNQGMIKEMLTVQKGNYGLGFSIKGRGEDIQFSHGGSNIGYKCMLIAFPERGQGVVVMTNGDHGANLFSEINFSLAAEYGWKDYLPSIRETVPLSEDILESYVGEYKISKTRTITISNEEGQLYIDPIYVVPSGSSKCAIYPRTESAFFTTATNAQISFKRNREGHVTSLTTPKSGKFDFELLPAG